MNKINFVTTMLVMSSFSITMLVMSSFSISSNASSPEYKNILGEFTGNQYPGGPPCIALIIEDSDGAIDFEIETTSQRLISPKVGSADLQNAIENGYEGQFQLFGPKYSFGLMGEDYWYVGGGVFNRGLSHEKLNFIRIQHRVSDDGFFSRGGHTDDLSCTVNPNTAI